MLAFKTSMLEAEKLAESELGLDPIVETNDLSADGPYGANSTAAEYCSLLEVPRINRGVWQHGWIASYRPKIHPDSIVGCNVFSQPDQARYWVSREDEADFFKKSGFANVRAIGLPFVYVGAKAIHRIPRSLLIMPAHSLDYTKHQFKFEQYAAEMALLRHQFDLAIVCLHAACWKNGYWIEEFRRHGFTVIRGANVKDRRGLARMDRLFRSFECITTNTLGSHVAYGAFCGARMSIYGSYAELNAEDYASTSVYVHNPTILAAALSAHRESTVRLNLPWLFCEPSKAGTNVEWGAHELGLKNKLKPPELLREFGWSRPDRIRQRIWLTKNRAKALVLQCVKLKSRLRTAGKTTQHLAFSERVRLNELSHNEGATTTLLGKSILLLNGQEFLREYEEVFVKERYRFYVPFANPFIIDLIAGVGVSVLYFKMLYPQSRILALEPDRLKRELLRRNCKALALSGVTIANGNTVDDNQSKAPLEHGEPSFCGLYDLLTTQVDLLRLALYGDDIGAITDCKERLERVQSICIEYYSHVNQVQSLGDVLQTLAAANFRVALTADAGSRPFVIREIQNGKDLVVTIYGTRSNVFHDGQRAIGPKDVST